MRGYYTALILKLQEYLGSPPLARVLQAEKVKGIVDARITPACAGITIPATFANCSSWDHPRLRGYYAANEKLDLVGRGSPPLARVLQGCAEDRMRLFRITHACAGITPKLLVTGHPLQDHPRLRGYYGLSYSFHLVLLGSPPLARVLRLNDKTWDECMRITPACAGITTSHLI